MKISVLGAGSWGTALARLLDKNGHDVSMWSWQEDHVQEMLADGENKQFLPGVLLPASIKISSDISIAGGAELVIFSVPSAAMSSVSRSAAAYIADDALIVNVAKGFIPDTLQRISEILNEELPGRPVMTLSGPSHAEEVARDLSTLVCVAGPQPEKLHIIQDVFMNSSFRVYTNDDIIGVEVSGAIKNIIAMACGVSDGQQQGDNAKAALITRGLAEIQRLGVAMGADPATFAGLAGVGDLVVTCNSLHSRNYRAGLEIGRGRKWRDVVQSMNMVVEGVYAVDCAHRLARQYQVSMPITEQMYLLLYEDQDPSLSLHALMSRQRTQEWR